VVIIIIIMEICHTRSLKISGTDTEWSASCDFLLHSNYSPILYHFRDKGRHLPNFPTRLYLMPPLKGSPIKFCMVVGLERMRMMPLPDCQKSVTIPAFV